MRFPSVVFLSVYCAAAPAFALHFERHELRRWSGERFSGAACDGKRLAVWGERILTLDLPRGAIHTVARPIAGALGPGGALVDAGGRAGLVLNEAAGRRALLWLDLRTGKSVEIDHGIAAHEILPATILGHRGILLVQRRIQVRFFEIPADPAAPWPSRDIYSFYSASDQGGLRLADVDGDGRPDILSGNYWIQSPAEFDLPWRLFATRVWAEEKLSGMVRIAWRDLWGTGAPNLIVSQSEMPKARVAWFERPPDPKQLWIERRIEGALELDQPRSLAAADFDGDGKPDLVVAESAGAGRIIVFRNRGERRFEPVEAARTTGVVELRVLDWNGDGRPDLLVVEPASLAWWENR